jgi:hypothetical protein
MDTDPDVPFQGPEYRPSLPGIQIEKYYSISCIAVLIFKKQHLEGQVSFQPAYRGTHQLGNGCPRRDRPNVVLESQVPQFITKAGLDAKAGARQQLGTGGTGGADAQTC